MHSEPLIVSGLALTIPNVFTILSTLSREPRYFFKVARTYNPVLLAASTPTSGPTSRPTLPWMNPPPSRGAKVLLQGGQNIQSSSSCSFNSNLWSNLQTHLTLNESAPLQPGHMS